MRGSERFTQRASTAITKAHDAALGMGHSYVGTEHILLGIIREGEGLGARILADNALTDSVLTRMVTETVGRGVPGTPEQGLSPRARHVIELAAEDSNRLGHCYVGTEHLLMGILPRRRIVRLADRRGCPLCKPFAAAHRSFASFAGHTPLLSSGRRKECAESGKLICIISTSSRVLISTQFRISKNAVDFSDFCATMALIPEVAIPGEKHRR